MIVLFPFGGICDRSLEGIYPELAGLEKSKPHDRGGAKDDGFVNDTEMEGPEHAVGGVVPPHRGHPVLHKN